MRGGISRWVKIYWPHLWSHGISSTDLFIVGRGLGLYLSWWSPSTMWVGPLIVLYHHRGCLNNPIFSNLGLLVACWALTHSSTHLLELSRTRALSHSLTLLAFSMVILQQQSWFTQAWSSVWRTHINSITHPLCQNYQPSLCWIRCHNTTGPLCTESTATLLALCVVNPLQHYWPCVKIISRLYGESTATLLAGTVSK